MECAAQLCYDKIVKGTTVRFYSFFLTGDTQISLEPLICQQNSDDNIEGHGRVFNLRLFVQIMVALIVCLSFHPSY